MKEIILDRFYHNGWANSHWNPLPLFMAGILLTGLNHCLLANIRVSFQPRKVTKALTWLDREPTHPLQLHAVKQSCCTAANPSATGQLSCLLRDNRPVAPGFAAVQQLRFTTLGCNGWGDSLSNPVRAFGKQTLPWKHALFLLMFSSRFLLSMKKLAMYWNIQLLFWHCKPA